MNNVVEDSCSVNLQNSDILDNVFTGIYTRNIHGLFTDQNNIEGNGLNPCQISVIDCENYNIQRGIPGGVYVEHCRCATRYDDKVCDVCYY